MSVMCAGLRQDSNRDTSPGPRETVPTAVEFHYTQTDSFVALLQQLDATLLVSTYQANKLLVARVTGAGLSMLVCALFGL